ncbi:MAG: RdgB/HAM1 family non-canonical purine NTP pyrophosphatase [Pseudomonadota bacterium]
MVRRLGPGQLVIASHNDGKIREIHDIISPFGLTAVSAKELNLPSPEETEATFEGNARIKAHAAARASGLPAMADDSGLEVTALNGAPGVYTADWAEDHKDGPRNFKRAMLKVANQLRRSNKTDKSARFICCLCLAWPDGEDAVFMGHVDGEIVWPPRGSRGFGYDPIFLYPPLGSTFGELSPALKHSLSHRANAFQKLVDSSVLAGKRT